MVRKALFHIATGLSLVVFLGCIWLDSFNGQFHVTWMTHGAMAVRHAMGCENRIITLQNCDEPSDAQVAAALPQLRAMFHYDLPANGAVVESWGDQDYHHDYGIFATDTFKLSLEPSSASSHLPIGPKVGTDYRVLIPLSNMRVLSGVLPELWTVCMLITLWRGKRRRQAGFCTACSYDLTGNVSGVCPECGVEVHGGASCG